MKHFQAIATLAFLLACLPRNDAVDIVVRGLTTPTVDAYLGVIVSAPTNVTDQSAAKIVEITPFDESQKSNQEIIWLMFWDQNTKYMPFDIFTHFHLVQTLEILMPFQDMASPVNGHFHNARNLLFLFIANQEFRSMGSNVFLGAPQISWIYLENNRIETIDASTFRDLTNLKKLSLKSNMLKALPNSTFHTLIELELLVLTNNALTFLPSSLLQYNKKLKYVYIDVNGLFNIQNLEAPAGFNQINLQNNLCTNAKVSSDEDLKIVERFCSVSLTPKEVIIAYREQLKKPLSCDSKDKDVILDLLDDIRILEGEIQQLQDGNEKLEEILSYVSRIQLCLTESEYKF